jgi:aspartate/methionine/tyrosine aminotransferase
MERAQKAFTANTKGLIVVNPTNPMGSFLNPKDQKLLFDLCLKNQTAYISDEVFSEYRYVKKDVLPFEAPEHLLTFRLGGLSKSLGLPQLKLSWMVIDGPENLVEESRNRLELIMDSYLSVNSPVQEALKELFIFAPNFQSQVLTRILMNRTHLEETFKDLELVKVWPAQGGWYALVEVMGRKLSDEKLVLDLLNQKNMLVQPGGFYDFSDSCFLVISLMVKTDDFLEAVSRLKEYFESLFK